MKLDNVLLKYSTTQFITRIKYKDTQYYFFFVPEGMGGQYCFDSENIKKVEVSSASFTNETDRIFIDIANKESSVIDITNNNDKRVIVYTLTSKESLEFWKTNLWGTESIILSNGNIIAAEDGIDLRSSDRDELHLGIFPPVEGSLKAKNGVIKPIGKSYIFEHYLVKLEDKSTAVDIKKINNSKAVINFTQDSFKGVKELFLKVNYVGDVGYAYIDGKLINDNFCNGEPWEIGLKRFEKELLKKGMYIYIAPIKKDTVVKRDSAMAAVKETSAQEIAEITSISVASEKSVFISREVDGG
jgi:hypothetical protein